MFILKVTIEKNIENLFWELTKSIENIENIVLKYNISKNLNSIIIEDIGQKNKIMEDYKDIGILIKELYLKNKELYWKILFRTEEINEKINIIENNDELNSKIYKVPENDEKLLDVVNQLNKIKKRKWLK